MEEFFWPEMETSIYGAGSTVILAITRAKSGTSVSFGDIACISQSF
jgi:hypothetical protein